MNILSLFDGISCGQLALQRAGIVVDKYYASEIDKYAIQITQKNFPNTIQLGDVTKIDFSKLPKIDILMGGSPCQDLSCYKYDRGDVNGLDGNKSSLFYYYVKALEITKPKYFLLENVASMEDKWKDLISNELGVGHILINSNLFCAAERKRLYWTNITNITQPIDKNINLKDIVLPYDNIDEKYWYEKYDFTFRAF